MFIKKSKIKQLEKEIAQLKEDKDKVLAELKFLKKYDKTEVVIEYAHCSIGFGFAYSLIKHKISWLYNGELKELETDIFGLSGVETVKTNEKDYAIIEHVTCPTCTKNYYMLDKAKSTITKVTNLIEKEKTKKAGK